MIPHINGEPSAWMWSQVGLPTSGPTPPGASNPALVTEDDNAILTEDGLTIEAEGQ